MSYNKVVYKGDVLMDITDSTVTPETLSEGAIAYSANGERIVGTGEFGGSGIIEVTELPTENIDTEAFYLCNGEYYHYTEGGNTWVFNDELTDAMGIDCALAFEFEGYENTKNGTKISFTSYGGSCPHIQYLTDYYPTGQTGNYQRVAAYCYDTSYTGTQGWQKEEYKTITITEMPTDEVFLTWLNANAKPSSGWVKYVAPSGALNITENGTFDVMDKAFVNVNIPMPAGDITITENGEFDVSQYENAIVNIPPVIEVDELPTEDINPKAVYIYNRDLYRYSADETWVFNDVLTEMGRKTRFDCPFTFVSSTGDIETCESIYHRYSESSSHIYNRLEYLTGRTTSYGAPIDYGVYHYSNHYENPDAWNFEYYKTITFTEPVPEGEFRTWLEANATCTKPAGLNKYTLFSGERLEGDGAEYYTMAPTALSFRSTEPLSELQEVQINGETVDPSNYTLEEGSTIVTFPIEYLKTLEKGGYEVSIVSKNKTVKGNFTVAAPELNEHGFYYNQPYSAEVSGWGTTAFFVREDGTYDIIVVGRFPESGEYTVNGDDIIATHPTLGTLTCTISADGKSIYCVQFQTNFVVGIESIVADDDYMYVYEEDLGGWGVSAIDKNMSSYQTFRDGIYDCSIVAFNDRAFCNCSIFTNIVIPSNIISIGFEAFRDCVSLIDIKFTGTVTQWNAIAKGDDWNYNVPATYVQCSDGQVAL